MQDKPWRNEELRRFEKALPKLKEGDLERASRMYSRAEWQIAATSKHNDVLLDSKKCFE